MLGHGEVARVASALHERAAAAGLCQLELDLVVFIVLAIAFRHGLDLDVVVCTRKLETCAMRTVYSAKPRVTNQGREGQHVYVVFIGLDFHGKSFVGDPHEPAATRDMIS